VDYNLIGNAPATLKLTPGIHNIRVSMKGYRTWTNQVTAQAGAEARLKAALEKSVLGAVYGRVLWNEKPVAGIQVFARECPTSTPRYGPGITDDQGRYTITGVPDGRICIDARSGIEDRFGNMMPSSFDALPGIDSNAPDSHLCKLFAANAPKRGDTLKGPRPMLKWDAFPEAVGYQVQVWRKAEPTQRQNSAILMRGEREPRLAGTSLQVDVDMSAGEYYWRVDAFNRVGHMIGCQYTTTFTVTNP
jgi:hypothetical protein